jgi:2-alkyl-3-oxoalkanoate reductase
VKVLVTGASGMLGRATAQALIERGDDVCVLQRRASMLGCREVLGDVADQDVVRRAAAGQDAVVHLAAKVDVVGRWSDYVHANVEGTRSVVQGCLAGGVARLVQVSSPSVAHQGRSLVGVGAGVADPATARGHYSRSKAVAERLALAADGTDLAVTAVRPHLVWGPGDTQLVARLVDRARAGRLPLLGSGAALIDTTYVDNAADALVVAAEQLTPDGPLAGRAFVVTNGEPLPLRTLLEQICAAAGVPPPARDLPLGAARGMAAAAERLWAFARPGDEPPATRFLVDQLALAHWFDPRPFRDATGWRPAVSIAEGMRRLAAFYRDGRGA